MTNPIVPMIFSTFLREHPKAQIYLNEGSMNKHVEMVTGEMLDLAYNAFPTAPEAEELEIIPMGTMEIHAVLHPDHPLARLDRIPLARLGEEKLIMMDAQSKVKELMSREFERHQVIPDILFNYDQVLCMANLVRSCRYVGIISVAQGQQALGCEGLAIRPFEEPVVFDVGFFLKKGRYLPKLGWELIRFIQENTLRGGT